MKIVDHENMVIIHSFVFEHNSFKDDLIIKELLF